MKIKLKDIEDEESAIKELEACRSKAAEEVKQI